MSEGFGADEWVVLSWFYDIGWDRSSFGELRTLGNGDPAVIPRLQSVLRALHDKGYVEVRRTNDKRTNEATLDKAQAAIALESGANWIRPGEPGFSGAGDFYEIDPTEKAEQSYEDELARGRPWVDGVLA